MPYCPQCGAEYTEGITTCHECGVPLLPGTREEEAPQDLSEVPVGQWMSDLLRPIGAQFARGLQYAAGALRLLWSRPALLVLPLLVVLFNLGEWELGVYLTGHYTAAGRQERAQALAQTRAQTETQVETPWSALLPSIPSVATKDAMLEFRQPLDGPHFGGLDGTVMAATGLDSHASPLLRLLVPFVLGLFLLVPFPSIYLAGYYGVLRNAILGEPSGRSQFASSLKQHWWQFAAYIAMVYLLRWGLDRVAPLLPWDTPIELWLRYWANGWGIAVLLTLAGVGLFAIVWDEAGPLRALGRSAWTVLRDWPVCLVLLAGLAIAIMPFRVYELIAGAHFYSAGYDTPTAVGGRIALGLTRGAFFAVLGVWLALAQFLWYRDANPAPAAPPAPTPTDTSADLTPQTP